MASATERQDRNRRRMLAGLLLALLAWVAVRILGVFGVSMDGLVGAWLIGLVILGGVIWLTYLTRMVLTANALRGDRPLIEALNDERVKANGLRAFAFGFLVVLGGQLVILIASVQADITLGPAVNLTLALGIIAAVGAFLMLDRE